MQAYPATTMGQAPVYVINDRARSVSPMPSSVAYSPYGASPALTAQEITQEATARAAPMMMPQQMGMGNMPMYQGTTMPMSGSFPAGGLATGMPYYSNHNEGMFHRHHHHHGMGYGGGSYGYGSMPYTGTNYSYGGGMQMPVQGGMYYPQQYTQQQPQPTVIHVPHRPRHRHHRHHHRHRSY